jgi:hypothetical protein
MKLNDMLNENQINEFNLLRNVAGAAKGAIDGGGIQGAVSGYKASQASNTGREHSDKIVNKLKNDFMQIVGGGQEATYQNLIDFLSSHGLSDLDTIPDPTQSGGVTGLPPPATSPVPEALGSATLNNRQIDQIISAAVKQNYGRIVAAQKGKPATAPTSNGQQSGQPNTQQTPSQLSGNPFNDPNKLYVDWAAYLAGGGKVTKKLRKFITALSNSAGAAQQPRSNIPPVSQAGPAPVTGPVTSTPESIKSRFLGIDL